MGAILDRSGLAEDLLDSIGQLFGPVRGGLSYAVIFVGALLGAITGTVAASVIAMAVIALPLMLRYGYSTRHATGVIAASGTITQLIPPSLVLIVLAGQLNQSVGAMEGLEDSRQLLGRILVPKRFRQPGVEYVVVAGDIGVVERHQDSLDEDFLRQRIRHFLRGRGRA